MVAPGKSKQEWRAHFRRLRSQLSPDEKSKLDGRIRDRLIETGVAQTGGVWTAYVAVNNEVDPSAFIESMPSVQWAFPRIHNQQMRFFVPNSQGDFISGEFGIPEPDPARSREVLPHEITGCLVPGLAFDRKGQRLGSGKGFYDRFLMNFSGSSVGLAYGFQISETPLPNDEHDQPVNIVITDEGVLTAE